MLERLGGVVGLTLLSGVVLLELPDVVDLFELLLSEMVLLGVVVLLSDTVLEVVERPSELLDDTLLFTVPSLRRVEREVVTIRPF